MTDSNVLALQAPAPLQNLKWELEVPDKSIITPETEAALVSLFKPLFEQGADLYRQAQLVKVENRTQLGHMDSAKELGKRCQKLRSAVTQAHKQAKEESLKKGKCIDTIKNAFLAVMGPVEDYLEKQANFIKLEDAALKEQVRQERMADLAKYQDIIPLPTMDLTAMSAEDFETLRAGTQARYEQERKRRADEAAAKEQERLAGQRERERLEAENVRLRARQELHTARTRLLVTLDALDLAEGKDLAGMDIVAFNKLADEGKARKEAKDKAAAAEKAERDKAAAAEKAKQDALQKELADAQAKERERQQQEELAKRQEQEAAAKLAAAPDREKLAAFLDGFKIYTRSLKPLESAKGKLIFEKLVAHFTKTEQWIEKEITNL
jgi:hypothetical protein